MCIICDAQKWCRRVATMLPWVVIPFIVLWALSQLLPPGFRFEVTSPRLACVLVLLVTLFWYEFLMPQLSIWRTRRIARLRERKRYEAIEMHKLRKMATKRCRNCSTPYKDQNPGGGKFMCSYCGHISKRPVLDIPGTTGSTNSGIFGDLVNKGGKILNGKVWSENGWICPQDWLDNRNSVSRSFAARSSQCGKSRGGLRNNGMVDKSGVFLFPYKILGYFFLSTTWIWRKMFRIFSSTSDSFADHKRMFSKRGENGLYIHESKVEKARRKAEERRQSRLERELLEEEEKKQREEVARLVEEQRKLRGEILEAEKERDTESVSEQHKDSRRDAERKRKERRRGKDKGSSKSNSDVEDLEKKSNKESEMKREFDKRSDTEKRSRKSGLESTRLQNSETGNAVKASGTISISKGTGGRYLDRVKGSILSSSKALNGATFFAKNTQSSAKVVPKTTNPNGSVGHVPSSANAREAMPELPPHSTPKKSWQQLFTRSPAVPATSNANAESNPNQQPYLVGRGKQLLSQASPTTHFNNQIHFGISTTSALPSSLNVSSSHTPVYSSRTDSVLHHVGPHQEYSPEEQDFFSDPCYIPDPVSLLGPVSESLDNLPSDIGAGFVTDKEFGKPYSLKSVSVSAEFTRPSPIESPMSRWKVAEEKHNSSVKSPSAPKKQDHTPANGSSKAEPGMWQMWSSPPLGQDGLGLVGGPSWLLPLGENMSNQHSLVHKDMLSSLAKEKQVLSGTCSPERIPLRNCQVGRAISPLGITENDLWSQKNLVQRSLRNGENHFPAFVPVENISRTDNSCGSPVRSPIRYPFELSPGSGWNNDGGDGAEEGVHGSVEGVGDKTFARHPVGSLFSTPDVQSLWSFN